MTGRVALVTGASRGLGASIAIELARQGHVVAVNHRNSSEAAQRIVDVIARGGGVAGAFAADITDREATAEMVTDIENNLGPISTVVLNATGPQPSVAVATMSWADVLAQLDFFVKSPTLVLEAVLPSMKQQGFGRFVHIGSEVVDLVPVGSAAYTCAKAGQRSLARSWAKELGPFGITVNTVSPGWIPVERHSGVEPAALDEYVTDVPLGHMGAPDDVAGAVAFLCSDGAKFVNGVNLTVNGGKTLD